MNRKHPTQAAFFNLRILIALLLCAVAGCFLVSQPLLAFLRPEALTSDSQKTLTFAQRVAYQRAIEEVYWRHRIWPKENPDPKPPLDAVMSEAQLETKVAEYLHKSHVLENYWQRPITSEQLQTEIDRMARDTKQPEILQELFEALGNDPFVVAECLARPILSERLVRELRVGPNQPSETESLRASVPEREAASSVTTDQPSSGYYLPRIASSPVEDPAGGCVEDTWTATSTIGAPDKREFHTAVWTGSEMIVWGGYNDGVFLNSGGRYDPSTDSWVPTTGSGAPAARWFHTAVWTGTEMIVWGGDDGSSSLNTGGRYNPSIDSWVATTTTGAPAARRYHTAVWTGTEMIVWGGKVDADYLDTGGRYNPSTDSWVDTTTTGAPAARNYHTAVWTGTEMIVWGGEGASGYPNRGGRYDPSTDSWLPTTTKGAPAARYWHTAVWAGTEMIVWGGNDSLGNNLNTGGRYNPSTDSWVATSTTGAPAARRFQTAVWTGSEMIIWAGKNNEVYLDTGGRYNPSTDTWVATTTVGVPIARWFQTAVWTGSEMIVWGGYDGSGYLNAGGRYCAQSGAPTPTPTATPTPGQIMLRAKKKRIQRINTVRLQWRGATSVNIDVYRNEVLIVTTPNDGQFDDSTGDTGQAQYVYRVCNGGTQTCSNDVTVNFPP
jgi:N-acetylneuraminic acid mutarotase